MDYVIFGFILFVWVGILAAALFGTKGKLPKRLDLSSYVVPVGVALGVWMWIFALAIIGA